MLCFRKKWRLQLPQWQRQPPQQNLTPKMSSPKQKPRKNSPAALQSNASRNSTRISARRTTSSYQLSSPGCVLLMINSKRAWNASSPSWNSCCFPHSSRVWPLNSAFLLHWCPTDLCTTSRVELYPHSRRFWKAPSLFNLLCILHSLLLCSSWSLVCITCLEWCNPVGLCFFALACIWSHRWTTVVCSSFWGKRRLSVWLVEGWCRSRSGWVERIFLASGLLVIWIWFRCRTLFNFFGGDENFEEELFYWSLKSWLPSDWWVINIMYCFDWYGEMLSVINVINVII